ncbi:hypothetical protein HYDPIDRAFT_28299 [Hydnomerulius pinastri MD-312]|uniref:Uncharacterized protein n=1 Tax=Hydnomerulius pinastri MD-312 TaxID=994086 RepID=A0A0C9W1X8_9AGAM|nr:hypothetical protein HYDPIDRAFT_28299 [Hydnomerulius pinastri MD-312]
MSSGFEAAWAVLQLNNYISVVAATVIAYDYGRRHVPLLFYARMTCFKSLPSRKRTHLDETVDTDDFALLRGPLCRFAGGDELSPLWKQFCDWD